MIELCSDHLSVRWILTDTYRHSYLTETHNVFFCEKLESVRYKDALAITGAIQGMNHLQ